jgi:N-acetylmuramoyl-L-alanine amidase
LTIKHGSKLVNTIFVHCAATRPEWLADKPLADKVAEIRRWHVEQNKWQNIGYHWLIDRDGSIAPGRPETTAGAHVAGHNTGSIGICLIGGFGSNENDAFEKHFTPEQDRALRGLIEEISSRTPIARVRGHNEVAAKACPGFRVGRWLAHKPAKPMLKESTTVQASAIGGGSALTLGASLIPQLSGAAQLAAIGILAVILLAFGWIARERIRKWAREVAE